MTWIILILAISVGLNVLFLWYIRQTLKKLLFASENYGWLSSSLENFSEHLQQLHKLDMFYGDTSLRDLIEHSKQLVEDMKNFQDIYTLLEDEPSDREEETPPLEDEPNDRREEETQ
tara:strand:+ start:38 stop:388 length:351 start_codon:yes stop_codon:yes gene_type:complete